MGTRRLSKIGGAVLALLLSGYAVAEGMLAIHAPAEKDHPSRLRFFEMDADEAAYRAHGEAAHYRKYADATRGMILSRRRIETVPIQLSLKKK